ncbi:MAG: flagellar assembly protein A, partial [Spirochaetota bacterium]
MAKTDVEVAGSVTISVDGQGVEAKLRFVRDPEGPRWDLQRILDELTSQGIQEGISHDEIRRHLDLIAKKGLREDTFVVASGLPAEQPAAEQFAVTDLPVPEEMGAVAERIVRNAGAPEITVQRTETVKRQKRVTKKSKLPFGKPKVESVEVTESRPVTEKIYVDPAVEGYGYVTPGQKVGDLTEAVAGSPGRSVYGEILHARVLPDAVFHLAGGIERRGSEAYATTEGILRWGRNWADLIPFSRHAWNVSLSPDKATCRLTLHPGNPELPPPEAEEIVAAAGEIGYPEESLLSKEEIAAILGEAISTGTPLEEAPISESRDASFDILVSEDKMQAVLNIVKGKGRGRHLVLKEVGKAIKESGLRGMDLKKVGADVSEFYRGADTELVGYVLAEGKPPTAGPPVHPDFSLRFMFEAEREAIKTRLTENAESAADIESWEAFPVDEIDQMAIVEKEQRIVGFPEPIVGEAGVTVYGEPVPGLPGESPELKLFENLEKKGIVVIATHGGVLDLSDREGVIKVRVRPHRDGSVAVRVTPDNLQAILTARDGEG